MISHISNISNISITDKLMRVIRLSLRLNPDFLQNNILFCFLDKEIGKREKKTHSKLIGQLNNAKYLSDIGRIGP